MSAPESKPVALLACGLRVALRAVVSLAFVAAAFALVDFSSGGSGLKLLSSVRHTRVNAARVLPRHALRRMLAGDDRSKLAVLTGHDYDPTEPAPSPLSSSAALSTAPPSARSALESPTAPRPKRVALAFFGLTRSLEYTAASIRTNVLARLEGAGIEYDVYLHTYDLSTITNQRSSEEGQALNTTEWTLLNPKEAEITHQADFKAEFEPSLAACRARGDFYGDDFASMTNLFCQLNSLRRVTRLWRASRVHYDAVIYLRPDMLYNCPLPVDVLEGLAPDTLLVPDFHHFKGWNDRFVIASPAAAAMWGDRLFFTLATCQQQEIHPERNIKLLAQHYSLDVVPIDFNFFRVRSDGLVEPVDTEGRYALAVCDAPMFEPFEAREALLSPEARAHRRHKIQKPPTHEDDRA